MIRVVWDGTSDRSWLLIPFLGPPLVLELDVVPDPTLIDARIVHPQSDVDWIPTAKPVDEAP